MKWTTPLAAAAITAFPLVAQEPTPVTETSAWVLGECIRQNGPSQTVCKAERAAWMEDMEVEEPPAAQEPTTPAQGYIECIRQNGVSYDVCESERAAWDKEQEDVFRRDPMRKATVALRECEAERSRMAFRRPRNPESWINCTAERRAKDALTRELEDQRWAVTAAKQKWLREEINRAEAEVQRERRRRPPSARVPIETHDWTVIDPSLTKAQLQALAQAVKAHGFRCDSIQTARKAFLTTRARYVIRCNGARYKYTVEDRGGTWVASVD